MGQILPEKEIRTTDTRGDIENNAKAFFPLPFV